MVSYEELCAALERYNARRRGEAPAEDASVVAAGQFDEGAATEFSEKLDETSEQLDAGDIISDEPGDSN